MVGFNSFFFYPILKINIENILILVLSYLNTFVKVKYLKNIQKKFDLSINFSNYLNG